MANNSFTKSKAVIELVERRKNNDKARITVEDFKDVSKKFNISIASLKRCWKNFNLYGKISFSYSLGGIKSATESQKEKMREYNKKINKITNPNYTLDDISIIIKEFIFGEYLSYKDFSNKYFISPNLILKIFNELDSTGKINYKNKEKVVLTFENPDGHGKLFPIREAIRYQRWKNKKNRNEKLYQNVDSMKLYQYENILSVLKEWL